MKHSLFAALFGMFCHASLWAADYQFDPTHTSVHFGVAHFERSQIRGRFNKIEVRQLQLDLTQKSGQLEVLIDPDSVDTGLRLLDSIIRSEQLLDSAQFPQIRFQSNKFIFDGAQLQAVQGELTLFGQTRPLLLQARRFQCGKIKIIFIQREVCGGDFTASFARSTFGLTRYLPDVGEQIQLDISIEASPRQ